MKPQTIMEFFIYTVTQYLKLNNITSVQTVSHDKRCFNRNKHIRTYFFIWRIWRS